MAKWNVPTCDLCGKVMGVPSQGSVSFTEKHYAACVTFGYCRTGRGWGQREDWLDKSYGELCEECFDEIRIMATTTARLIESRRGINDPRNNNVSDVQEDQPQPKRRALPLLRKLS